jgi:transcriptional regulator with XRE-family HTH domain
MSGTQVRTARRAKGLNQTTLATKLGVSQGYVSLLERAHRPVHRRLASKVATALGMPATALPVADTRPLKLERATRSLAALGYEGFGYSRGRRSNPTAVLLGTLRAENVDGRVVEALPWLLVKYPDLDWEWLVSRVKQADLQNRLGFVVSLARELAALRGKPNAVAVLSKWESALERSRLQASDTFARSTLTESERHWLRDHSSPQGKRWNVLSTLSADALARANE